MSGYHRHPVCGAARSAICDRRECRASMWARSTTVRRAAVEAPAAPSHGGRKPNALSINLLPVARDCSKQD